MIKKLFLHLLMLAGYLSTGVSASTIKEDREIDTIVKSDMKWDPAPVPQPIVFSKFKPQHTPIMFTLYSVDKDNGTCTKLLSHSDIGTIRSTYDIFAHNERNMNNGYWVKGTPINQEGHYIFRYSHGAECYLILADALGTFYPWQDYMYHMDHVNTYPENDWPYGNVISGTMDDIVYYVLRYCEQQQAPVVRPHTP